VASASTELLVSLANGPTVPYSLQQSDYLLNSLANGALTGSSTVTLAATSTDNNQFLMYYELIGNGSSFITSTNTPVGACAVAPLIILALPKSGSTAFLPPIGIAPAILIVPK